MTGSDIGGLIAKAQHRNLPQALSQFGVQGNGTALAASDPWPFMTGSYCGYGEPPRRSHAYRAAYTLVAASLHASTRRLALSRPTINLLLCVSAIEIALLPAAS